MKLRGFLETVETFMEAHHWVLIMAGVLKTLAFLAFVMHWAACGWHAIGKVSEAETSGEVTWITLVGGFDSLTAFQRYSWSLYFTMTTMTTVGYGDIHPTNITECSFALF